MKKNVSYRALINTFCLIVILNVSEGCYHYRVITQDGDGGSATEYQKKVLWTYFWGLVNKPREFTPANCDTMKTALNEVRYSTNFGYALLTVASLGILCPTKVEWKCHKPCQRIGGL